MGKTPGLLFAIVLMGAAMAPAVYAATPVSVEFGYLHTNHNKYGDGFVWGGSLRGDQRLTFGVGARWYEEKISWETDLEIDDETVTFWYEETFKMFSVSAYGYYILLGHDGLNKLLVAAGPQVHFVTADKAYIRERYVESVRESRLGFGGLLRYERVMEMFGGLRFVAEFYYSYMEGTYLKLDYYQPPLEPVNMTGFMAGLGYPL
jgi:hypothetical protein